MRAPRVFVHCATSVSYAAELGRMVPGPERYAERAGARSPGPAGGAGATSSGSVRRFAAVSGRPGG